MTYRELKLRLAHMTDLQLDKTVRVFDCATGEANMMLRDLILDWSRDASCDCPDRSPAIVLRGDKATPFIS